MKSTLSKFAAASVAGVAVMGSSIAIEPAHAITDLTGSLNQTTLGLTEGSVNCNDGSVFGATSCVGAFLTQEGENDVTNGGSDNPASKILATGVFGGITNWTFNAKKNVPSGGAGTNPLGFSIVGSGTSGTFDFTNLDLALTNLAISLKGGPSYSMYYIPAGSLTSATGINWNTLGIEKGNGDPGPGLSHASVYYSSVPNPIPTPALLPGLIGMGVAALRKRKGEAEESAEA